MATSGQLRTIANFRATPDVSSEAGGGAVGMGELRKLRGEGAGRGVYGGPRGGGVAAEDEADAVPGLQLVAGECRAVGHRTTGRGVGVVAMNQH